MSFTTDEQALLAAILANPDDIAPRLVYADWLDEHEQPERAWFIREAPPLRWCRLSYGKWGWMRECRFKADDNMTYWDQLCRTDAASATAEKRARMLFPQTWRRNLNRVVYRNGFVDELGVDCFHSNTFGLLERQPVRTVTTTAEALLEVVSFFDECKSLRTIELMNIPAASQAMTYDHSCIVYFPGVSKHISVPILPKPMRGNVDSPAEVAYRLGRVFGHYLAPLGIAVKLPEIY